MDKVIFSLIILCFGIFILRLSYECFILKCVINKTIDARTIIYSFKIMEIKPYGKSYILKSIDSIQIKLAESDFVNHSPKVNDIFIMMRTGEIVILPSIIFD